MEDILDLYAEPYDPRYPVVCFDESPYQLVSEVRQPLAMAPGRPVRDDYEYCREGTCNLVMFLQPLQGWRHIKVTARRTAQDFAHCMQDLVDHHFPKAQGIRVVLEHLNPHTPAALYETFAPAEARRILRKLDLRYTPKHGSWLNMAEIAFAVVAKPCLDQRIPDQVAVRRRLADWEAHRHAAQSTVNWQFTTAKARRKLSGLYPV
jgi:DDE superfamily endonuclease